MPVDPTVWASLPFNNLTAFYDFTGTHWLWHLALQEHVERVQKVNYAVLPIGDGRGDPDWLAAVQRTYQNAATALNTAGPPDLQSYDLSKPDDFSSFCFLISTTALALRAAAGLP